ncbi:MAG: cyclic nucleotide-binding domain-containing protein [Verrucomicrobiota bacterium]|nr:cyclic nucleotide-binding domain-containing protein [Verrucomicrobiota bacterium]
MQTLTNPSLSEPLAISQSLARMPVFEGLKPEWIDILAQAAMRIRFNPGQLIFRQGEQANCFYLIEEGKVSLLFEENREPCRLTVLGKSEILGWSWLFPPHLWQFTARAVSPSQVLFFCGTRLREICEKNYEFGYELMKRFSAVMVQRLQCSRLELIRSRREVYRLSTNASKDDYKEF